jgi:hypothetical protein
VTTPPLNAEHTQQVTSPLARQAPPWFYGVWHVRSALVWGPDWQQKEKAERASQSQRAPMEHGSHRNEE